MSSFVRTAEQTRNYTKFLLDGMLGSLSRWLRIAGYDTKYYVDKDDRDLLREAFKTHRVLLTRDKLMVQRAEKMGVDTILVSSDKIKDQLNQIKKSLGLILVPSLLWCPLCNGELSPRTRDDLRSDVPEVSLNAYEKFWMCVDCQKIYWKGSHWKKIMETLSNT